MTATTLAELVDSGDSINDGDNHRHQQSTRVNGKPPIDDDANESIDDPHRLARLFLLDYQRGDLFILRYWQDEFLFWTGRAYDSVPRSDVVARLCTRIKKEFDDKNVLAIAAWEAVGQVDVNGKTCPKPVAKKVTTRLISDVMQALASIVLLPATTVAPSWIGNAPSHLARLNPIDLVVFRNGIGCLPQIISEGCLHPHTPHFFTRNALTYDYIKTAPEPTRWLAFLRELWMTDQQAIDTLQEAFGYSLTPDTRQQKIFLLVGPRRGGKGTVSRIWQQLVGKANCCSPTLAGLATNFGMWPLLDKSLAFINDARLSGRVDQGIITERLLSISGEDSQTIDRKNRSHVTLKLPTRFVILTNELPRLKDSSGALAGRFIVFRLTQSWYGKENPNLTDELSSELPSILRWAIAGWDRLTRRGRFIQPESSSHLIGELEDLASPVGAFVRERCEVDETREILCRDLFLAWSDWCKQTGRKDAGTDQLFFRDLRASVPNLFVKQNRSDGRVRSYHGIGLTNEIPQ